MFFFKIIIVLTFKCVYLAMISFFSFNFCYAPLTSFKDDDIKIPINLTNLKIKTNRTADITLILVQFRGQV